MPKTSVCRYLLQRGFNTTEGLTEQAQQLALQEFKPEAFAKDCVDDGAIAIL